MRKPHVVKRIAGPTDPELDAACLRYEQASEDLLAARHDDPDYGRLHRQHVAAEALVLRLIARVDGYRQHGRWLYIAFHDGLYRYQLPEAPRSRNPVA